MNKKKFRDFESAREFARSLKLKNGSEWTEYCKSGNKPDGIPSSPYRTYRYKGWISWQNWLGVEFTSFRVAREFARALHLKGTKEWNDYCRSGKKPDDIPTGPAKVYKNEFKGMGDWLGTGTVASFNKIFCPFKEAQEFVRKLKLKNMKEWYDYCRSGNKPDDIPANPHKIYKNEGWNGYDDFLDTGVSRYHGIFCSFKEAREFVRKLKLKNMKEWYDYSKSGDKPDNIPSSLSGTYKNKGWVSWGDVLGTGTVADKNKIFRSCKEAKEFVRALNLKNQSQWQEYCNSGKKPDDIPSSPLSFYKNEFKGMGDWLGTGTVSTRGRIYRPFKEARDFVRKLNLKNYEDWEKYCASGNKPNDIPSHPWEIYKEWNKK
jgi:hypothetical protein